MWENWAVWVTLNEQINVSENVTLSTFERYSKVSWQLAGLDDTYKTLHIRRRLNYKQENSNGMLSHRVT